MAIRFLSLVLSLEYVSVSLMISQGEGFSTPFKPKPGLMGARPAVHKFFLNEMKLFLKEPKAQKLRANG